MYKHLLNVCLFINLLIFPCAGFTQNLEPSQFEALQGPNWVREGVIYSIFTRNFSSEGDFQGITNKLEALKNLGITTIWLLPIHPIGQKMKKGSIGSPYCIQDYYAFYPSYGNKEDFQRLVNRAHQLGLKVIIDMVANHTSWDSVLMNNPDFYKHDIQGNIIPPIPDWHDVAALEYNNPDVRTYMINMIKYWLTEFNLDGFRFDAAGMVPLDFWQQMRKELHEINPNILLLGEGDNPQALAKAFDLDYSWDFERALNNIIQNGAPATSSLQSVLALEQSKFPKNALHLRFSDNHDKKRAITRYGEKASLAVSALIFTFEGVPLIYNGMEVGDTTESTDPALFEKAPIQWHNNVIRPEFKAFYQHMIALRKKHHSLRDGELVWLKNSDNSRIVTYLRKSNDEEFFIAINLSNRPFEGNVENGANNNYTDVTTPLNGESASSGSVNFPSISLKPWEYRILYRNRNQG
ncbi:MAG: alpha-amylase [Parachlamydiaceae bacterium]|nr:alpha-amylase [Parachlamydiaceae bacterium]